MFLSVPLLSTSTKTQKYRETYREHTHTQLIAATNRSIFTPIPVDYMHTHIRQKKLCSLLNFHTMTTIPHHTVTSTQTHIDA